MRQLTEGTLANHLFRSLVRTRGFAPWALALLVAGALTWPAAPALAERRVALVVGNGSYDAFRPLPNAGRDAKLVAATLGGLGFEVEVLVDAPRAGFDAALGRLARAADGADLALLFYAGHGLQVGGDNYLVPTDATLTGARSLQEEALDLPRVMRSVEKAKVRLVFLDACRDNPLAGLPQAQALATTRSLGRGLAPVAAADLGAIGGLGTLIGFSTAPGTVALDGTGADSPFATALAEHLAAPGLGIADVMRLVRRDVYAATKGRQVPWDNSSLTVEVVLKARPETTVSESDGHLAFTSSDGRRVTVGKNVVIGKGVNVFGAPVTVGPAPEPR